MAAKVLRPCRVGRLGGVAKRGCALLLASTQLNIEETASGPMLSKRALAESDQDMAICSWRRRERSEWKSGGRCAAMSLKISSWIF